MSKSDYTRIRAMLKLYSLEELMEGVGVSSYDVLLLLIEEGVVSLEELEESLE